MMKRVLMLVAVLLLLIGLRVGILRIVLAALLILGALLVAFFLASGLGILAVLRRLLPFLGRRALHLIHHVRHRIFQLVEHA